MLVTTHATVAMTLTVTTGNPSIYLPAAVANHPILDMVPHFGFSEEKYPTLRKKMLWPMVIMDMVLGTSIFFIVLEKTGLPFWLLFSVCVLAAWPDLYGLYQHQINPQSFPKFRSLHDKIQTESPWFFWVELVTIGLCLWLILVK